ncbi:hypothetical protein CLSA_c30290 [Clostridium saccharobutylicum DSM 13864]|uniref:Uncharacterized protein n=1 Tax=Clostridium saccharobutylicum DSM 13864 TaxID=1345695 RepID=U5MWJ1_CLOSA|nr:hypothetical protein CLSA_c30290 [Clostridium saccharobutylicum DSM 13864]
MGKCCNIYNPFGCIIILKQNRQALQCKKIQVVKETLMMNAAEEYLLYILSKKNGQL